MSSTSIMFYNLSGASTTVSNSVSPALSSEYWGPVSASSSGQQIPEATPALTFSRNEGIKWGDTWTFTSALVIDGINVGLQVQLTGTAFGSDMSQYLYAGDNNSGWWSSNDTMTVPFTGASGACYTLQASLITRFACLYSDFILTVSQNMMLPNQFISVGQQLNSSNGLLNIKLQPDGLSLYRTEFDYLIWGPTNPGTTTANTAIMQDDGNFVIYDDNNVPLWDTATANPANKGICVTLGDDGNLVVYNLAFQPVWSTNFPALDWTSPTFGYTDGNGYSFVETSEMWKQLCQNLPCSLLLQWPDYETAIFETTLKGEAAVIQTWRGFCPQLLNMPTFPGGVGGEVGVYRRIPGKVLPTSIPGVPQEMLDAYLQKLDGVTDLWWPAPELVDTIQFSLINLENGNSVFFDTEEEPSYWNCKWMSNDSYANYQASLGSGKTPTFSDGYQMNFTVNGQSFIWNVD